MATPVYDSLFLPIAEKALGNAFDVLYRKAKLTDEEVIAGLRSTKIAQGFNQGNPYVIAGNSGNELAREILESLGKGDSFKRRYGNEPLNEYFWAGYVFAFFLWKSGHRMESSLRRLGIDTLIALYHPYHEMAIEAVYEKLEELLTKSKKPCALKYLRTAAHYSQSDLARASGVPLRSIQEYEQGRKNLGSAQISTVLAIAKVLWVDVEDLLD